MACLCEKIAGKDIELSPTCIGHLWIFENLDPEEVKALSGEALRNKLIKGQSLFLQGDSADEMFLIKGGRIKLTKVLEDGNSLPSTFVKPVILSAKICFQKRVNTL